MDRAAFRDLVEARRAELKLSMADVSERVYGNRTRTPVQDLVRGAAPSIEKAQAICEALGLEFYIGPPRPRLSNHEHMEIKRLENLMAELNSHPDSYAPIPFYPDAALGAGTSTDFSDREAYSELAVRIDWFGSIGIQPGKCAAVHVRGDSMHPTLCDGDIVILDQTRDTLTDGKVFGFVDADGAARVKRLERRDGVLLLISDNKNYRVEVRSPVDANRIKIIGRVAWHGHRWDLS